MLSEGCIDSVCTEEEVRLNASAFSNSMSLVISLSCDLIPHVPLKSLVDSGSTHCFIKSAFVCLHSIKTRSISSIPLHLFDGSTNSVITRSVDIPIILPDGHTQSIDFYVTPLDTSVSAVLGHNSLTCYNLLIDWVWGSITFRTAHPGVPVDPLVASATACATTAESSPSPTPASASPPKLEAPKVALINAAVFVHAWKLEGTQCFPLNLAMANVSACSAKVSSDPVDLQDVLKEYHDFADVFSKAKADTLPPHRPYDLRMNLLRQGTEWGLDIRSGSRDGNGPTGLGFNL